MFHSTDRELRRYVGEPPFAVVGDPPKALCAEFGVASSPRSVLDPGAVPPALIPIWRNRRQMPPANVHPTGGHLGLPADFLIRPDGRVLAANAVATPMTSRRWTVDGGRGAGPRL